ncbi:hypothetical protein [Parasedimentitalea psychrophila]|uniref:Uncharacterized protein n=1 Tax=Parasedimentitalea psychrophila TaxID=2997337 RepID=A0A9Y2KVL6_9RHOB|nr:hypothetical protein [Parasedimentitalea psychrophila]WIY23981.1 hypothetical protein QPJ95_15300 [Parasedimentitalea psychrophila]
MQLLMWIGEKPDCRYQKLFERTEMSDMTVLNARKGRIASPAVGSDCAGFMLRPFKPATALGHVIPSEK